MSDSMTTLVQLLYPITASGGLPLMWIAVIPVTFCVTVWTIAWICLSRNDGKRGLSILAMAVLVGMICGMALEIHRETTSDGARMAEARKRATILLDEHNTVAMYSDTTVITSSQGSFSIPAQETRRIFLARQSVIDQRSEGVTVCHAY